MDGHPRQNPAYRPANEKPRASGASLLLSDVEQDEKAGDHGNVEEQTEDGDRVVGIALVRPRIPCQRWKHAKQDRDQRHSEPNRDDERSP